MAGGGRKRVGLWSVRVLRLAPRSRHVAHVAGMGGWEVIMTTMRIARQIRTAQGAIIRTEVGGEFYVRPEEYPNSPKMDLVRRTLAGYLEEEPGLDWHLESRGTERSWHREENTP